MLVPPEADRKLTAALILCWVTGGYSVDTSVVAEATVAMSEDVLTVIRMSVLTRNVGPITALALSTGMAGMTRCARNKIVRLLKG